MFPYREANMVLKCTLKLPNPSSLIQGVSIDTRTINPGDVFIALSGERSDGHKHLAEAFQKGASGAVVSSEKNDLVAEQIKEGGELCQNILVVEDPFRAMTELVSRHRVRLKVKGIAITGSIGKTTTKEFLYFLLKQKHKVLANSGNFNNHLGVPLTLSKLKAEHLFYVIEMGANHVGEIKSLSNSIKPEALILTRIAPVHLEGFGSLENIYSAKLEALDALPPGAPVVIFGDDLILREKVKGFPQKFITVGYSSASDYKIEKVYCRERRVHFTIKDKISISFPGTADFLALNGAMAAVMAVEMGLSWDDLPKEWDDVNFPLGRFHETITSNNIHIIDDSYNASPTSFENALKAFHEYKAGGKKVVIFSDMLELGEKEKFYHEKLGKVIASYEFSYALAYGERSLDSINVILKENSSCRAKHFSDPKKIAFFLKNVLVAGDALFLKGSRAMHVESVLEELKNI